MISRQGNTYDDPRTTPYQIQTGKAPEFLKLYETEGLALITKHVGLKGCWIKESGVLNSVVFLWFYEDFGHRTAQRAKLGAGPVWQAFVPKILSYLVHHERVLLNLAGYSPLQ